MARLSKQVAWGATMHYRDTVVEPDQQPACHKSKLSGDAQPPCFSHSLGLAPTLLRMAEMLQRSKRRSVPQIFIGEQHVGGLDDLAALERGGKLDPMQRNCLMLFT